MIFPPLCCHPHTHTHVDATSCEVLRGSLRSVGFFCSNLCGLPLQFVSLHVLFVCYPLFEQLTLGGFVYGGRMLVGGGVFFPLRHQANSVTTFTWWNPVNSTSVYARRWVGPASSWRNAGQVSHLVSWRCCTMPHVLPPSKPPRFGGFVCLFSFFQLCGFIRHPFPKPSPGFWI